MNDRLNFSHSSRQELRPEPAPVLQNKEGGGSLVKPIVILLSTFSVMIASSGWSEQLTPIDLRLPLDRGEIHTKCSDAFQQALQDKEDYESQPQVHLKCAFNINGDVMTSLTKGFLIQCQNTASALAGKRSEGTVTLDTEVLKAAFNEEYRMIFERDCWKSAKASLDASVAPTQAPPQSPTISNAYQRHCSSADCRPKCQILVREPCMPTRRSIRN